MLLGAKQFIVAGIENAAATQEKARSLFGSGLFVVSEGQFATPPSAIVGIGPSDIDIREKKGKVTVTVTLGLPSVGLDSVLEVIDSLIRELRLRDGSYITLNASVSAVKEAQAQDDSTLWAAVLDFEVLNYA